MLHDDRPLCSGSLTLCRRLQDYFTCFLFSPISLFALVTLPVIHPLVVPAQLQHAAGGYITIGLTVCRID